MHRVMEKETRTQAINGILKAMVSSEFLLTISVSEERSDRTELAEDRVRDSSIQRCLRRALGEAMNTMLYQ